MDWFTTLKTRCLELVNDNGHSMTHNERNKVTKGITRQGIVNLYENAYVELSESYGGLEDSWKEGNAEIDQLKRERKQLSEYAGSLQEQVEVSTRRINGLLEVIEKDVPEPIYQPLSF